MAVAWRERSVDSAWSWVVVAATFALLFFTYSGAYTFGVFFPSLEAEFQANRAETAFVFSVIGALYALLGVLSGPAADRFGTRPVCMFGVLAMGLGLLGASQATALWQVYLGYGLGVALGMGCTFAPANAGLQRWFTRRRGLASGFASAGIGVSVLAMPPLVAVMIDEWGWRFAAASLGLTAILLGAGSALLMKDPTADGAVGRRVAATAVRTNLKTVLFSRAFVALYLSSLLCCVGIFIPFVHLVPYAIDSGFGESTGVFLVVLIGAGSLLGRMGLTPLSDGRWRRLWFAASYAAMGLMFFLWYAADSVVLLWLFALIFGAGYGGYVGMVAPIVADYFGLDRIGSVLGIFMSSIAIGGFAGPLLAGYAYDLYGSYDMAMLGAGIAGLGAAVVAMLMPAQPRRSD